MIGCRESKRGSIRGHGCFWRNRHQLVPPSGRRSATENCGQSRGDQRRVEVSVGSRIRESWARGDISFERKMNYVSGGTATRLLLTSFFRWQVPRAAGNFRRSRAMGCRHLGAIAWFFYGSRQAPPRRSQTNTACRDPVCGGGLSVSYSQRQGRVSDLPRSAPGCGGALRANQD